MIGIISLAALVAALILGRVVARKLGGGAATGFIARRGVAETVALLVVAGIAFPLAGFIDFLLGDELATLGTLGWVAIAAILVAGVFGWRAAGRLRRATPAPEAPAAANDGKTDGRRNVA